MVRFRLLAPVLVIVALAVLPALAAGATLSGTVKGQPAGEAASALEGATVSVVDPGTEEVKGTDVTDALGAYSIAAPSGSFDVHVEPPEGPFSPTVAKAVDLSSPRTLNFTLVTGGIHRITGILRYPDGEPLEGSKVFLDPSGSSTTYDSYSYSKANGFYELEAPAGEYVIRFGGSARSDVPQFSLETDVFELTGDAEIDLQLPPLTELSVSVLDVSEEGIPMADVYVPGAGVDADLGDLEGHVGGTVKSKRTDAEGNAVFPVFDDSVPFAPKGSATPPIGSGYAEAEFEMPAAIEGPVSIPVHPEATVYYDVAGTIRYDGGAPLQGAKLTLESVGGSGYVDTSNYSTEGGAFSSLTAPPGTYIIRTSRSASSEHDVPAWSLTTDPFVISEDLEGVELELPPTAPLTVSVVDVEEEPLAGASVWVPRAAHHVGLGDFEGEIVTKESSRTTDSEGKAVFDYFDGGVPEGLGTATPGKASEYAAEDFEVPTIEGPTAVKAHPAPLAYFDVSGYLFWPGGTPIEGAKVTLLGPQTDSSNYTPESGFFGSLTVPAGEYRLQTSRSANEALGVPGWTLLSDPFEVSEDVEGLELELPPLANLTVRVLDESEEPFPNVSVVPPMFGLHADLGDLEASVTASPKPRSTDAGGEAVFGLFDGAAPLTSSGYVEPPGGSGYAKAEFEAPTIEGPTLSVVSYAAPSLARGLQGDAAARGPEPAGRQAAAQPQVDAKLRAGKRNKVAVRFRAPGARGLDVLRAFPRTRAVDCRTVAPKGPWSRAAQAAPLQRSRAGVYTYSWDVSGIRGCALLRLGLKDGDQREVLLER